MPSDGVHVIDTSDVTSSIPYITLIDVLQLEYEPLLPSVSVATVMVSTDKLTLNVLDSIASFCAVPALREISSLVCSI